MQRTIFPSLPWDQLGLEVSVTLEKNASHSALPDAFCHMPSTTLSTTTTMQ